MSPSMVGPMRKCLLYRAYLRPLRPLWPRFGGLGDLGPPGGSGPREASRRSFASPRSSWLQNDEREARKLTRKKFYPVAGRSNAGPPIPDQPQQHSCQILFLRKASDATSTTPFATREDLYLTEARACRRTSVALGSSSGPSSSAAS